MLKKTKLWVMKFGQVVNNIKKNEYIKPR